MTDPFPEAWTGGDEEEAKTPGWSVCRGRWGRRGAHGSSGELWDHGLGPPLLASSP